MRRTTVLIIAGTSEIYTDLKHILKRVKILIRQIDREGSRSLADVDGPHLIVFDCPGSEVEGLAAYQGALFSMTEPLEVLRMSGLTVGSYVFHFGLDTTVKGVVDQGFLVYDRATLQVVEATPPVLSYIFPATTYAGASDETLTLLGNNFAEGATVNFNGVGREATVDSSTHLTAEITAKELADLESHGVMPHNYYLYRHPATRRLLESNPMPRATASRLSLCSDQHTLYPESVSNPLRPTDCTLIP